jgi:hypothetical protein
MKEIFRIVNEFPAYRISNKGNVQTRWRRGYYYSKLKIKDVWRDIIPRFDGNGYLALILCDGYGTRKTTKIHKLVAQYFLPSRPASAQLIRHLDGVKYHNEAINLAYGTYVDNENDKKRHGIWNNRGGGKVTPEQVKEIRQRITTGATHNALAVEFKVSRPTITRIANHVIWKNI